MKRRLLTTMALGLIVSSLGFCDTACGQERDARVEAAAEEQAADQKEWYYGPTSPQPEQKTLGRQRAEARALARTARMESMRWYGFSASRPMATGIPFTTMYSPQWSRPGGRPFAWYTSQRPIVVVSPYYPSYVR